MVVTENSHEITKEAFEQANLRGQEQRKGSRALTAVYDAERQRIVVGLSTHLEISFPVQEAEGLNRASAAQLSEIKISPSGLGLHFPQLDVDLYVPSLLQGSLGSKSWEAARLGASGGASKSAAKASAARENGKRGGRPRKTIA